MDFAKLMADVMADHDDNETTATLAETKAAAELYLTKHVFKVGDAIQWKDGLRTCRKPDYRQPVIVLDVRPGQESGDDPNTNHYKEPNDICCGIIDKDGSFERYWHDSNRFEPYTE